MRLTRRFAIILTLAILVVLSVSALILIRREISVFDEDTRRDHLVLARGLARSVRHVWPIAGEAESRQLVEEADARWANIDARLVWLDAPAGHPDRPALESPALDPLASGTTVSIRRADDAGEDVLYTFAPVNLGEPIAVELREPLADQAAHLRRTIVVIASITAALVVACGGVALVLGFVFVGRPMRLLIEQSRRIGKGDLSARIQLRQRDEIGELANEMNTMGSRLAEAREVAAREVAARIATVEELRHADRLTTIGKLAAGVAHELGTPLNVMIGRAQLIKTEHPGTAADNAEIIIRQGQRMAGIIRQLLDFARRRPVKRARQDLSAIVRQTAEMLRPIAAANQTELAVIDSSPVQANVDESHLQQALSNLVVNAIQAAPGGNVRLSASQQDAGACITVADDGAGIAAADLPRVFEPFFTTKDVGQGTGLGLSVAHGIIRDHGGQITVDSELGVGTTFRVQLPTELS
jgi:signal transduction histidine kinase